MTYETYYIIEQKHGAPKVSKNLDQPSSENEIVSFNLSARKEEETVYDEVKGQSETNEPNADTNGKLLM